MATKHDLPNYSEYFYPIVAALKARGGLHPVPKTPSLV